MFQHRKMDLKSFQDGIGPPPLVAQDLSHSLTQMLAMQWSRRFALTHMVIVPTNPTFLEGRPWPYQPNHDILFRLFPSTILRNAEKSICYLAMNKVNSAKMCILLPWPTPPNYNRVVPTYQENCGNGGACSPSKGEPVPIHKTGTTSLQQN